MRFLFDGVGDRLAGLLVVAVGGDAQLVHPLWLPRCGGETLGGGVDATTARPFFGDADDAPRGGLPADDQLHGVAGVNVGDGVLAGDLVEHDGPGLTRVQPAAFQQRGRGEHGGVRGERGHRDAAVSLVGVGAGDGELSWPGDAGLRDVQGLDPADAGHPLDQGGDLVGRGRAGQLHVDVPVALLLLLFGYRLGTGAQGHPGDEHHARAGQQAHGEQEPGGASDGVAQRHEQTTVEAANATQPGQDAGRRAGLRATAVVVDRRPHRGAAGFDQRYQRHQRWQAEADSDDHHVGPPGSGEAGGLDAEEPEECPDRDAAEQDGRAQREQRGRHGYHQRHRQVQAPDARRSRADRLHDADLGYLLSEQVVEHVRDQHRAEQQGCRSAGEQREEQRVGLPLVGMRVGRGNLNLADRQPVFALQPFADVAGDGHDGVAVPARRGLPRRRRPGSSTGP